MRTIIKPLKSIDFRPLKCHILVFVLTLIPCIMHAQEKENYGSLYFMPSIQFFDFGNLNALLSQNGFEKTGITFANGIGGLGTIGRWRIGGEGVYFNSSADNQSGSQTTMNGGLGYFYGGYEIPVGKWQLVPMAGIGFGGVRVNAIRATNASLSDVISSEPNGSVISNGNVISHAGLMIERILEDNFIFGVKGGYNFALASNQWEAPGLSSSVSDPFGGFQINLMLGFLLR